MKKYRNLTKRKEWEKDVKMTDKLKRKYKKEEKRSYGGG